MTRKLLIATGNRGKFQEYCQLLRGVPYQLTSLRDEAIEADAEETGTTYEQNATLKAAGYARVSGLLTLADDSGIEVDALDGGPGVGSARFGGLGLSDADRVRLLLARLQGVPPARRGARFVCVIALLGPDVPLQLVHGECPGTIAPEPRGEGGFGYDPVFFLPELGVTVAELPPEQKNRVSHRGKAAAAARQVLLDLAPGAAAKK